MKLSMGGRRIMLSGMSRCSGGDSATERKTLCLSLAPRQPAVYCRPSSPPGIKAALVRASVFRGAVVSFVCGRWASDAFGERQQKVGIV